MMKKHEQKLKTKKEKEKKRRLYKKGPRSPWRRCYKNVF
jgi:hypothetical protein